MYALPPAQVRKCGVGGVICCACTSVHGGGVGGQLLRPNAQITVDTMYITREYHQFLSFRTNVRAHHIHFNVVCITT